MPAPSFAPKSINAHDPYSFLDSEQPESDTNGKWGSGLARRLMAHASFRKWASFIGFAVAQVATNVSNKVSIDQYSVNMAFFQGQFMNIVYVVLGLALMLPMQFLGHISPEQRLWRNHWWCYIPTAVLDSWSVWSMSMGGNFTPGDWQNVLQQLTFPLTLLVGPLLYKEIRARLGASTKPHLGYLIASAVCLMGGVLVTIIPGMGSNSGGYQWYAVLMFSSANITSTISFLIEERYLRTYGCSSVHVNVWNAIYMVPITFLFWPFQALIPGFGGMPMSQLWPSFRDGFVCFAGVSVEGSSCGGAGASEMLFSVGTFVAGCFAVVLVKEGSAAFQWAANVAVVPLSNLVFAWKSAMPATAYQPSTWYVWVGAVIVAASMAVYGWAEHKIDHDFKGKAVPVQYEIGSGSGSSGELDTLLVPILETNLHRGRGAVYKT